MMLLLWLFICFVRAEGMCGDRAAKPSVTSAEVLCKCAGNESYSDKSRMQFALDALGEIDNIYTAKKKICDNRNTPCDEHHDDKNLTQLLGQIPRVLIANTTTVHTMRYTGTHYHLEARNGTWVHMSYRSLNLSVTVDGAQSISIVVFEDPGDPGGDINLQVSTNIISKDFIIAISGISSTPTYTMWASAKCTSYWKAGTFFSKCKAGHNDTPLLLSLSNLRGIPPGVFVVLILFLIACGVLYCLSKQSRTRTISIIDKLRHYFWQGVDNESDGQGDELSGDIENFPIRGPTITIIASTSSEMSSLTASNNGTNPFVAFQSEVPPPISSVVVVVQEVKSNPLIAEQPPGPPPLLGCNFSEMMKGINTGEDSDIGFQQKQPPGPPPLPGCDFGEMMKGINTDIDDDSDLSFSCTAARGQPQPVPVPVPSCKPPVILDSSCESFQSKPCIATQTVSKSEDKSLSRTQASEDSEPHIKSSSSKHNSEQLNTSRNSNHSARESSFQEFYTSVVDPFADNNSSSELSFSSLKGATVTSTKQLLNPLPVPVAVPVVNEDNKRVGLSVASSFGSRSRTPQFNNFNDMLMSGCKNGDSSDEAPRQRKNSSSSSQSSPISRKTSNKSRQSLATGSLSKHCRSRKVSSCEFPDPSTYVNNTECEITSETTPIFPSEGLPGQQQQQQQQPKRGWHPRSSSATLQGIIDMLPKITTSSSREIDKEDSSSSDSILPPQPLVTGQFINFLKSADDTTEDSEEGMEI